MFVVRKVRPHPIPFVIRLVYSPNTIALHPQRLHTAVVCVFSTSRGTNIYNVITYDGLAFQVLPKSNRVDGKASGMNLVFVSRLYGCSCNYHRRSAFSSSLTSGAFCNPKFSNEVRMWIGGQLLVLEEIIEDVLY